MMLRRVLVAAAVAAASAVQAQVPVVESSPVGANPSAAPVATPGFIAPVEEQATSASSQNEIFYQLQVLQQEVLELRGLVEEQSYELKRLKQQRLDDYLDLDRRLSALGQGALPGAQPAKEAGEGAGTEDAEAGASAARSAQPLLAAEGEAQSYRAAYDLLKKRQIDEAVAAFSLHLENYPQGKYAANAHYWLGEIYLLKNDLESARQWFTRLLEGFAGHRKEPDAKFKLGKVYDLLGDKAKAKALLEEVAASGADAARLARSYLQQNF